MIWEKKQNQKTMYMCANTDKYLVLWSMTKFFTGDIYNPWGFLLVLNLFG